MFVFNIRSKEYIATIIQLDFFFPKRSDVTKSVKKIIPMYVDTALSFINRNITYAIQKYNTLSYDGITFL